MKHKKLLIAVTCLFFVVVSIICFTALYRVADVIVTAETVVNSNEGVSNLAESYLSEFKGKNLVFTSTNDIKNDLENKSPYLKVEKVNKKLPNVLEVVITERKEAFAIKVDNYYYVLDTEFFCVAKKQVNENNIDGNRNILLDISVTDYSIDALQVGKYFNVTDTVTQNYLKSISASIINRRADIYNVGLTVKQDGFFNRKLILTMTEGMVITIEKADLNSADKLNFAYNYYLSADNKSVGSVIVTVSAETGDFIIA